MPNIAAALSPFVKTAIRLTMCTKPKITDETSVLV
jgi:hypothetical protein